MTVLPGAGIGTGAGFEGGMGIGVGVGVGMLLAPASGEETRSNLSHRVHEFSDRMRDKFATGEQSSTGTYGS